MSYVIHSEREHGGACGARAAGRCLQDGSSSGGEADSFSDWVAAESALIQDLFRRQLQADLSLMMSAQEVTLGQRGEVCVTESDVDDLNAEMSLLRHKLDHERAKSRAALAQAAAKTEEYRRLREERSDIAALLESACAALR